MSRATPAFPRPPRPRTCSLDRQVCFALAVASRNVIGLYRPLLEPMGLTHPQYLVMLALWEENPLTVAELGGAGASSRRRCRPSSSAWSPRAW